MPGSSRLLKSGENEGIRTFSMPFRCSCAHCFFSVLEVAARADEMSAPAPSTLKPSRREKSRRSILETPPGNWKPLRASIPGSHHNLQGLENRSCWVQSLRCRNGSKTRHQCVSEQHYCPCPAKNCGYKNIS